MRPNRFPTRYALTLIPIVWMTWVQAEDSPFVFGHRPEAPASVKPGAPWSEALTRLPPLPDESDLIELELDGSPDAFRYFIDGKHLSVGPDQVVRYTVVARSANGTGNLAFEGLRCTLKGQYRVYAYGTDTGFTPVNTDWQGLGESTERYRAELWRHHFCVPRAAEPRSVADMLRSLKGRMTRRQDSGFTSY